MNRRSTNVTSEPTRGPRSERAKRARGEARGWASVSYTTRTRPKTSSTISFEPALLTFEFPVYKCHNIAHNKINHTNYYNHFEFKTLNDLLNTRIDSFFYISGQSQSGPVLVAWKHAFEAEQNLDAKHAPRERSELSRRRARSARRPERPSEARARGPACFLEILYLDCICL